MQKVRKGVVPAAGLGTRLYPMSRAYPKEMLLIGDKPMIYYTVLEAALSGMEEIYVVISKHKDTLRNYLEGEGLVKDLWENAGKKGVQPPVVRFVEQPLPRGSGEAIYGTKDMLAGEPFAVMMPDRILFGTAPALHQIIPVCERGVTDVLGVLAVDSKDARGFGNVGILEVEHVAHGIVEVHSFSSKSKAPLIPEEGQTFFKYAGRGIFGPHFFSYLEKTRGEPEEWDDTPAIQAMLRDRRVLGKILDGTGFDVGNPTGYRLANKRVNDQ
ncbi:MAG: hypothetical protein JRI71_12600 [Deltaproteobacteria bacterium]|nr:hypothetical protein [Deltaproteobacteria bacterium]